MLVDSVVDYAIFMLDLEGCVATWNAGAARIKGYRADEIVGEHFSKFYSAEDNENGKPARLLQTARDLGHSEDEGWRIRKDGTRFWASVVITALRDEGGNLRGFGKVTRDLTTQREAEERARDLLRAQTEREFAEASERRIRESEVRYKDLSQRLEIILENVADGITAQDRHGRVIFANAAAARICGFDSAAELIDTPPAEIVARFEMLDEDGRPFPVEELPGRRVLAGEMQASATLHIRERRSGREWWSRVRAKAVTGNGTNDLAINIWHDVTAERRQDRQTKYLSEATATLSGSLGYEKMLSSLASTLVPGLGDGCAVYVVDGGALREVAFARTDEEPSPATDEYRRRLSEEPAMRVTRTGKGEIIDDASGKAAALAPIRVRDRILGAVAVVSVGRHHRYDSSDLELLEELGRRAGVALENVELYENARAAANEAERASHAKDQFLATVSHELRTPLSAILGWSELLSARTTDASLAKPIDVIHRNALAQVKIIDDILDVSRVITGKFRLEPRRMDIVAVAKEAIEVVRPSATAKRIEIRFNAHPEHCWLVADPDRLQQVVWNLLSNAIKFTEAGGRVEIDVRREGTEVLLSVTDSGVGLDAAFLPHVFERFRQADSSTTRRVGGLGLGLALVRHIVELHGGRVSVRSEGLGRGATFGMSLPLRAATPQPFEAPSSSQIGSPEAEPVPSLGSMRILIVEDEPDARELLATLLRDAGATVETASSAAEGFKAFASFRPDVLVSDIGMPDEDGFSFIRRIRALPAPAGGRVPSVALTAFARDEDRAQALEAGYTTHLGKPVNARSLIAMVRNLAAVNRTR